MTKRLFLVVGLSMALAIAARAQDVPKTEVFGGYSYGNFGPNGPGFPRTNLNGWNASLTVNLNRWFGFVSDSSGHCGNFSGNLGRVITAPICTPAGCVPPCTPTTWPTIQISENDKYHNFLFGLQFSMRAKAVTLFAHARAWRIQADYLQTGFASRTHNDLRFSTGSVFHF